eukprot:4863071-Amphidinium_carterae.1
MRSPPLLVAHLTSSYPFSLHTAVALICTRKQFRFGSFGSLNVSSRTGLLFAACSSGKRLGFAAGMGCPSRANCLISAHVRMERTWEMEPKRVRRNAALSTTTMSEGGKREKQIWIQFARANVRCFKSQIARQ